MIEHVVLAHTGTGQYGTPTKITSAAPWGKIKMLDLHITGTDLDGFRAKILSIVGSAGLAQAAASEDLLSELRQRMAEVGTVVKLVPFDGK